VLNNASLTIAGLLTVIVPLLNTYELLITYAILLGLIIGKAMLLNKVITLTCG